MAAASSAMGAQSMRLRLVAENLANADTPQYRRKLVPFETVLDRADGAARVRAGRVFLDSAPFRTDYQPGHPLADASGLVALSNVDPLIEIADAREANRSYEANLSIFDQARRMHGSMLDLLRR
jgi:flagellar basal-body rod protein FlgC